MFSAKSTECDPLVPNKMLCFIVYWLCDDTPSPLQAITDKFAMTCLFYVYTFSTVLAYVLDFSRVRKIGVQKREVQITRRIKQKREGKIRTREPQNEQGGITLRQR